MGSPGSFRFLHAADLHIDSPLRGLARYEGAPAERIRGATREAVDNLVALAKQESVDLVVIAGDVFDGDWKDVHAGLWFQKRLEELVDAGTEVFLLRGNHDAASTMSKGLALPDGVRRFRDKAPETHRIESLGVALHGQSFAQRDVTDNLSIAYPEPIAGVFNIGVLHTSLAGYEGHDSYAPCSVADLVQKGYDYWALGHVHGREVVRDGDPWIVFPGNPQGRHARETGPKGATLVAVEDGEVIEAEHRVLDAVRWAAIEVDAHGARNVEDLLGRVRAELDAASRGAAGRLLAVRVTLCGATPLDGELRRSEERIDAEVRASGFAAAGEVWVEKVRLRTTGTEASRIRGEAGFAALADRVRDAGLPDEDRERLAAELAALVQRLPAEVRARVDSTELLDSSLGPARALLAAHFAGPGLSDSEDGR
ncbi:MAG: DNA repair exonuclease [Planctomycetota bacterium]